MKIELKPCPFCGAETVCISKRGDFASIYCKNCGSMGPTVGESLLQSIIKPWNIRAEPSDKKLLEPGD